MRKKDTSRIIIYVLVALVFNMLYFMKLGFDADITDWVGYGAIHLALVLSCGAPFLCLKYKRIPENLVNIYVFAWLYLGVSVIFNGVFMITRIDSLLTSVAINVICLVIFLILIIVNMNNNHDVEKSIETIEAERQFVQDTAKKLKGIMQMTNSDDDRRVVEKAYDAVRTSPLHSNAQVMNYEVEVIRLVDQLEQIISQAGKEEISQSVDAIVNNVKKRNAML